MKIVRVAMVVACGLSGGAAFAHGPITDVMGIEACFQDAEFTGELPRCVGDVAARCQASYGVNTETALQCIRGEAFVWNRLLNEVYAEVGEDYARRDVERAQTLSDAEALMDAQRDWIAFRDDQCGLSNAVSEDVTIQSIGAATCRSEMTARRAFELRALLEP